MADCSTSRFPALAKTQLQPTLAAAEALYQRLLVICSMLVSDGSDQLPQRLNGLMASAHSQLVHRYPPMIIMTTVAAEALYLQIWAPQQPTALRCRSCWLALLSRWAAQARLECRVWRMRSSLAWERTRLLPAMPTQMPQSPWKRTTITMTRMRRCSMRTVMAKIRPPSAPPHPPREGLGVTAAGNGEAAAAQAPLLARDYAVDGRVVLSGCWEKYVAGSGDRNLVIAVSSRLATTGWVSADSDWG